MNEIQNNLIYQQRMKTTIIDKLFWTNQIFEPVSQLVDIGCADGFLLNTYKHLSPDTEIIGIDNNENVLNSVKKNIKTYTSISSLDKLKSGSVVNMSSVLHEVYSYNDEKYINQFWTDVINLDADYIAIRDMYCDKEFFINDEASGTIQKYKDAIIEKGYSKQMNDFEKIWGPINNIHTLTHFILKYPYIENWDREVQENYLSWSEIDVTNKLRDKYIVIYKEKGNLPYIKYRTKNDLGIAFSNTTHIKIVLKRRVDEE